MSPRASKDFAELSIWRNEGHKQPPDRYGGTAPLLPATNICGRRHESRRLAAEPRS